MNFTVLTVDLVRVESYAEAYSRSYQAHFVRLKMTSERARPARLTLITPVFNESPNIDACADAVTRVIFADPEIDGRVIFVDDGSSDDSWAKIETLAQRSSRFSGVRLSRNFGAHYALTAGFDHVEPNQDVVATLACDLQDPPETVLDFILEWRNGADIVWGARRERADSWPRKTASHILNYVLRRYAMPKNSRFRTGSFLLMDRTAFDCFLQYREHNRVTFALVAWTGFNQATVPYDRKARIHGATRWSFGQMLNTAYDVFIGFSPVPAKFVAMLGFTVFTGSILFLLYLLITWSVTDVEPGWTGIMTMMTVLFGLLFMMVGMLAEYLYRIFIETKRRPLYFVSKRTKPAPLRPESDV
ncbi:glycosyltransferase family 2 protein [Nitrobacter sp. TKz-YC02]|uniref:glycosyltransferase family 2 protein n=1 Tax=Nitrobacter sp. TKz-YC02 TaxID=3398704 RepID=UPI003CF05982